MDSNHRMNDRGGLKRLTSIVAIDRNGAIGAHNSLPWRLKSDLKFFKKVTSGNTVILGRKTFESIGKCLPNRKNIVLSHTLDLFASTDDCRLVHSLEEALFRSEMNKTDEVFVIGGAMTYLEFAPLVDRYLVTVVDCEVANADAYLEKSILQDFARWDKVECNSFPSVPGQDDYAFSVFEIRPDGLDRRCELRRNLFREFADQIKRPSGRSQRTAIPATSEQLSLI